VCPLTKHRQEQNKENIFHGHLLGGVKDLVAGRLPAGRLVFTGALVDVAGLLAGRVGLFAGEVAGAGGGDLAAGVEDLAAGVAARVLGFF
jgi:hypothetical protein